MSPGISVREYIRWLPGPPKEPTSTLVLTSKERHFVDIRILKQSTEDNHYTLRYPGIQMLSQLDWAFAGTSATTAQPDGKGGTRVHSTWRHFVDSRTADAESVVDEGDIFSQPGGQRALECGRMINPKSGELEDYEESWIDLEPAPVSSDSNAKVENVVILLHDDDKKQRGMVVRIGRWCQGIVRIGDGVSLERWVWTAEGSWKRTVRMGDIWLPCGLAMDPERVKLGGEVKQGEQMWKVVELDNGAPANQ